MARRVFFSFHYQHDVWRVNQIRNIPNVIGSTAAGFQDASLWEKAKTKGAAEVKKLIDKALENTSVTIVFIGNQTAGRTYINYETDKSIERGNGLVGIQIHHLQDQNGNTDGHGVTPRTLTTAGAKVYKYVNKEMLAQRIRSGGSSRPIVLQVASEA